MLKTLRKYLGLLGTFFKMSLMSELEFRFNIGARIVTDIVWYTAQLSVFEVLFRHTSSMNGWSLQETRVFMGLLFITDAFYMMFFSENLDRLGDKVRKGDLDLLLVKPVNSQWMLSFQKISVAYFGNLMIAFAWLGWSLSQVPDFEWIQLGWIFITIPIGLSIIYAIRFATSATSLYFTRADAITYIWYQVYRLGTRPHNFYPAMLRYAVLSILPIAFLASVPAQIILGKIGPTILIWGSILALTLLKGSSLFWKRGLRTYSSASS